MTDPLFLLFFRPYGPLRPHDAGDIERLVDDARVAALRDTAARARQAGFERIVIATSTPDRFSDLPGVELDVDGSRAIEPGFAARFRDVLTRHRPSALCYAGAGMPLITGETWAGIRRRLETDGAIDDRPITVTNNLYSSDLLATTAIDALINLPNDTPDNGLALFLRDDASLRGDTGPETNAGFEIDVLPRSAATLLDIDTPTDLQILSLYDRALGETSTLGPDLRRHLETTALATATLDTTRLETAIDHFTVRETEVLVVGRVGAATWQALERDTASRVRVISEERGMRATQRAQPRSILGFHLGATDPVALIDALSELGDAVFMDTRPLYAHLGWNATRADRFHADLLHPDDVQHPDLCAFARAAANARLPIILGGHSLVSGGLLAAIDTAWARWESPV